MEQQNSVHWADIYADKIIREKGDKELYTCASGITPSGTVHIGNFREIISVDLVVKALRQKGRNVRFIYSWDDYDVFRKVPKNMYRIPHTEPTTMPVETSLMSRRSSRLSESIPSIFIRHSATEAPSMPSR